MPHHWPVDLEQTARDLADLVAIPSVSGSQAEVSVQDHLAEAWRQEGLRVQVHDAAADRLMSEPGFPGAEVPRAVVRGVVAEWPGTGGGRRLLLNGHTDVVPPGDAATWQHDPFRPAIADRAGRKVMYGRGTCDMKGGLVAAWEAVRALRAAGVRLRGDVVLASVSAEEDGGMGTFAMIQGGLRADACIIGEPTGLDVIPANAGALTFRLRVPGRAAHASRRAEGVSAVERFVPILAALREQEQRRNQAVDPLMSRWPLAYPLSIGTVRAGDWASTVPGALVAEGRLGVALGESVAEARADLERTVAAACERDEWLAEHPVSVEWIGGQFAPAATAAGVAPIPQLCAAHGARTGRTPQVYGAPYGSDLRLLVAAGIPTALYGPGDSAVAHAADEWVDLDQVLICAQVIADVIVDFCG